jgi:NADPH-dependent 2,4-dienoyl-CoA reductase/sulfur reductase-like enzyme/pSer/pThr/pTyr-binding forkhead associated (FHA) protein
LARKRYVIIGDGAAGMSAAQKLRRSDPSATIGVLSDDPHPAYYRAALTNYLLGELRDDQLWAVTPDFYESFSIHRILGRVIGVDTARSELWEASSRTAIPYDALLVAAGGRPRQPTFDGAYLPGVMTLRTLQDARRVVDYWRLGGLRRAVVLGGGALGLEWAHALREHDVKVTILERAPRFLPGALDEVASDLLTTRLRHAGIDCVLGDEVVAAHPGQQGSVAAVTLRSGRVLECELVAAALGVVPNSEFLGTSGIKLSDRGAVMVSHHLRTSVANVYAAGDVASVEGEQLLLWEPARHQGRVAAENMVGREALYQPGAHYFATRLFDLDFARIGNIDAGPGREAIVDFPRGTGTIAYRKLVLENGRLVGTLMIGERSAKVRSTGRALKRLIDERVDVSAIKGALLDPSFDFDGFLHTQKLLEKPPPKPVTAALPAARVRGTQVLALGGGGTALFDASKLASLAKASGDATALLSAAFAASAASGAGSTSVMPSVPPLRTSVIPSQPPPSLSSPGAGGTRGTKMLSIGLQAEAVAPAPTGLKPIEARLDGLGRSWPIGGGALSIGGARDCNVVLDDPGVASLHAQIVRHGDALYLRDAGSQTGTWVNAGLLASVHRLADGDCIVVGQCELWFRSPDLKGEGPRSRAAEARAPHVAVRSGASIGLSFALGDDEALIGSAPGSRIYLPDHGVAPQHARLRSDGQCHYVNDLGTGFATGLRGGRLGPGQEYALEEGDVIRIGPVDLLYSLRGVAGAAAMLRPRGKLAVVSGPGAGA